ncbi:L,D-transpeptidase family protein [Sphingomonas gilva]|nr:L,D-transpeptidase family protein [Sphingomonas gilva]
MPEPLLPPPVQQTAPMPPVARAQPLPALSPAQAADLQQRLTEGGYTQGLRYLPVPEHAPLDNDTLVRAALDYARAVHSGRLAAEDFKKDWGLRPAAYDPLPAFADAVRRDQIASWFVNLPPPYAGYDSLQAGLMRYRAIAEAGGWKPLTPGADMELGAKGKAVAELRERLSVEDPDVIATGDSFDAELKEAVVRAQRRYGLNPAGLVGPQTRAALNVPVERRVRQIMANLERWRWLPAELDTNRIQVNIAAAVLTVFEGDRPVMSMKGVTGRPGDETPMLQSAVHSIVINPPWNVPAGIAKRELFPKGAAYLKANGFRVIGEGDGARLQQAAGPQSALGRFKFDFDNPYAVYLHDTPSQSTFSRYDRLASHGCVRVERPADLAQLLLRDDPAWGADAIQAAVDTGKTQRVKLPEPATVYLLYWTAYASADGTMNFRADPYDWDSQLAEKIERRSAIEEVAAR